MFSAVDLFTAPQTCFGLKQHVKKNLYEVVGIIGTCNEACVHPLCGPGGWAPTASGCPAGPGLA